MKIQKILILILIIFSINIFPAIYKIKNKFAGANFNTFVTGQLKNIPEISVLNRTRMEQHIFSSSTSNKNNVHFFYRGLSIGKDILTNSLSEFHSISLPLIDTIVIYTGNDAIAYLGKQGVAINLIQKKVKSKKLKYGGDLIMGSQMGDAVLYREIIPKNLAPLNREKIVQGGLFVEKKFDSFSLRFAGSDHRYQPHRYIRQDIDLETGYQDLSLALSMGNLYTNSDYYINETNSLYSPYGWRHTFMGSFDYRKRYFKFSVASNIYLDELKNKNEDQLSKRNEISENHINLNSEYTNDIVSINYNLRSSYLHDSLENFSTIRASFFNKKMNLMYNTNKLIYLHYNNNFKNTIEYVADISVNLKEKYTPINLELALIKDLKKINIHQRIGYNTYYNNKRTNHIYFWNTFDLLEDWTLSTYWSELRNRVILSYNNTWKRLRFGSTVRYHSSYIIDINDILLKEETIESKTIEKITTFGFWFAYSFNKEKINLHFSLQDAAKEHQEIYSGDLARTTAFFGCKVRL